MIINNEKEMMVDKKALAFGLMAVFLCAIGFGIINPVVPFLVGKFTVNQQQQATAVTLLTSVYAICVFLVAPGMGALSDRFGRRPILLMSLVGSALGYLIFGVGGALWILFLGRIIEGITAGTVSTIFAYFADITSINERTKYFGWLSAVVGVGSAIGPALGGILAKIDYSAPLYFGAIVSILNAIFGYFFMPETLKDSHKLNKISFYRLNPFTQLLNILSIKNLKWLLISGFLIWMPNGSLQAIFSQLIVDSFHWEPAIIGLVFSIIGVQDIISQTVIMPKLIRKFSDIKITKVGMISEIIGYIFIMSAIFTAYFPLLILGVFIFGFGDSILGPSFNGMLSKSVNHSEQGRIQGGSQSIQALARIIGPLLGGQIYSLFGHWSPLMMGVVFISFSILIISKFVERDFSF